MVKEQVVKRKVHWMNFKLNPEEFEAFKKSHASGEDVEAVAIKFEYNDDVKEFSIEEFTKKLGFKA